MQVNYPVPDIKVDVNGMTLECKGTTLIKRPHTKLNLTKEQIAEYIKCQEDIIYFAQNYYYIVDPDIGLSQIKLYDFQKEILLNFVNDRHNILLSARQSGKSTISGLFLLWYMMFNNDKSVGILANKEKTAIEIFSRIKTAYEYLPNYLKPGVTDWSKTGLGFDNGSKCIASSTSSTAIRGFTINTLFLDEIAFVPSNIFFQFYNSVYPTISKAKKSKIIQVSCVVDDTFVFTNKGIKQVKDFIDYSKPFNPTEGYQTREYHVLGKNQINYGNVMCNNGKAITNIIKSTFSELECSEEHKFWGCKDGKYDWYKSKQLAVGDYVSIQYGENIWGENDITGFKDSQNINKTKTGFECDVLNEDISYFLGLYISEGYARTITENGNVKGKQITITCGDDISPILKKLKLKYSVPDGIHYRINNTSLVDFMEYLGFDITLKAPQKIIPSRLLEISRPNIKALLQGIFDGDGFSRKDKGYVGIGLSSKELIKQIRIILNNFGILTDYQEKESPDHEYEGRIIKSSMQYRLSMNGQFSKVFYNIIGFRFERKQDKQQFIKEGTRSGRHDIIPFSQDIINEFKKEDTGIRKLGLFNGNHKDKKHFSRNALLGIETGNEKLKSFLEDNVTSTIVWQEITAINKSENYVYDFSLYNNDDKWCHSVIYNGYIGHQTANGMNHFYKFWEDAKKGINGFHPFEVKWNMVPGRDEKWKQETIAQIGLFAWQQEFENSFLGSMNTLISTDIIKELTFSNPVKTLLDGNLNIYEEPVKDNLYIMGVDTSKGVGRDYSVTQVVDVTKYPFKQVATFRSNTMSPMLYIDVVLSIGQMYNSAYAVIENNSEGKEVADGVWYTHEYINMYNEETGKNKDVGFRTTKRSKSTGLTTLKELVETKKLIINDLNTIDEISTFILQSNNNVYSAEKGKYDDTVTALLFFCYFIRTEEFKIVYKSHDLKKELYADQIDKLTEEFALPVMKTEDGQTLESSDTKVDNMPPMLRKAFKKEKLLLVR